MAVERIVCRHTPTPVSGSGIGLAASTAVPSTWSIRHKAARGLGLVAAMAFAAAATGVAHTAAAQPQCPVEQRVAGMCLTMGLRSNLPVVSDGKRFMSQPHGNTRAILDVARAVKRHGTLSYERVPALRVSGRTPLQTTRRYDYRFPESCGGHSFTYLDDPDLKALGLHRGQQFILDVLTGGGTFSAPRLWGVNDQVLNETTPMKFVAAEGSEGGLGLFTGTYAIGFVAILPEKTMREYGHAYAAATSKASQCMEVFGSDLAQADW